MATQVVPEGTFTHTMSQLSGLGPDIVASITAFLTFDARTKRPDIFLQPLFRVWGHVLWSPYVVVESRQPRNALKLLCQDRLTANLGATLNGSREKRLLERFAAFLTHKGGYQTKSNTPICAGGRASELDLLAFNPHAPTEVLLIQAKTPIAADDANEIDAVTRDLAVAATQCKTSEAILLDMPLTQRQQLFPFVRWRHVREFHKLVITPDSEPHGHYDHEAVPAVSLVTIEHRLSLRKLRSPSVLVNACRAKRWQDRMTGGGEAFLPIHVGEVTYQMPLVPLR